MKIAVQPSEAPCHTYCPAREHLVSRALFQTPDGKIHHSSVSSTLEFGLEPGSPQTEHLTAIYELLYRQLGFKLLKVEFVKQTTWEIGQ